MWNVVSPAVDLPGSSRTMGFLHALDRLLPILPLLPKISTTLDPFKGTCFHALDLFKSRLLPILSLFLKFSTNLDSLHETLTQVPISPSRFTSSAYPELSEASTASNTSQVFQRVPSKVCKKLANGRRLAD